MEPGDTTRVVLVAAPPGAAEAIALVLVTERLAACVNLLGGVRSIYRWEGKVHRDEETLLVIKTTASMLPALETRLRQMHPYEVPELMAFAPAELRGDYLGWLTANVGPSPAS